jgi:hypothetical protein
VATRLASALLALQPVLVVAWVASVSAGLTAARPERAWILALPPIAAVLLGRRTRGRVTLAAVELATLLPAHAWITLLRAARLEGG